MFGIPIFHDERKVLEDVVRKALRAKTLTTIFTPNPEQVMLSQKSADFLHILQHATLNIPDGIGIVWASRVLFGSRGIKERISGRELVPFLLQECARLRLPVLLIGGYEVSAKAADVMRSHIPNLEVFADPGARDITKETKVERLRITTMIRKIKPAVVLVGYGAPHQEQWMRRNVSVLQSAGVRIAMAVGGTFALLSGTLAPPPQWIVRIGCEWMWRLILEPWRWKRQLALIQYVGLVIKTKFSAAFS